MPRPLPRPLPLLLFVAILIFGQVRIICAASSANLIRNPNFIQPGLSTAKHPRMPIGWTIGAGSSLHDSKFWLPNPAAPGPRAIGITGGRDRQGQWSTILPHCTPGVGYRFGAEFYRPNMDHPNAYPEVMIWGKTFRLNTIRITGRFQPVAVDLTCPRKLAHKNLRFSFINLYPETNFWMRSPSLKRRKRHKTMVQRPPALDYFPIGAYGATAENLKQIKAMGFNSAVIKLDRQNITACLKQGLHCAFAVPHEPKTLAAELDRLKPLIDRGSFSFYLNDEPGIHAFPGKQAAALQHLVKARFPKSPTAMAIVRPQIIPFYQAGADFFMLDQYPIPNMPLIWLSDSLDEAAGYVGRHQLQAVIQAFGGPAFAKDGWPRRPSFTEINSLAFLALIHGSRGLYFFTFPEMTATKGGKKALARVVTRLNRLQPWLVRANDRTRPAVTMESRYGYDPSRHPAVQCALKQRHTDKLLLCVNTIRTPVDAAVRLPWKKKNSWHDDDSGYPVYVVHGALHLHFSPLGVHVLISP